MKLQIRYGLIEIQDFKIKIRDNERHLGYAELFGGAILFIQSGIHLLNFITNFEPISWLHFIYIPCFIVSIAVILNRLRFTSKSTIHFNEIKKIKHLNRFGKTWNDIYIENKIRRIHGSWQVAKSLQEKLLEFRK